MSTPFDRLKNKFRSWHLKMTTSKGGRKRPETRLRVSRETMKRLS